MQHLGPEHLKMAGEALFGTRWQTDLANALQLSDVRRIRQWMAGERKIPAGIWGDICILLRRRQMSIDDIIKELTP